jgi:hypothetical protein
MRGAERSLRREPHARGQLAVQLDLLDDRLAELLRRGGGGNETLCNDF